MTGPTAFWRRRYLGCDPQFIGLVVATELWLMLLWVFYWGHGVARGVILAGLLVGLTALRIRLPANQAAGAAAVPLVMRRALVVGVVILLSVMATSDITCLFTKKIPMDEGQTSWRAARLLWRGENPYGAGALTDFVAYMSRSKQREAAGLATLPAPRMDAALKDYDATLDPGLRARLLPVPATPSSAVALETHVSGYKYGPLLVLVTALVAPLGAPAMVMLLNGLATWGLFGVNWRILRRIAGPQQALAAVAILALMCDRHIVRDFMQRSATDVWALLFGSLAVLACLSRRPLACAGAIATAVGFKILPGLLFLPLLVRFRWPWPVLTFVGLTGVIYLPWLLWDPRGIVDNVFLWPLLMPSSDNSWQHFAPPAAALIARIMAVTAMAILWLRYAFGLEKRLFWTMAMANTVLLLATGYLANNYIPWASLWIIAALVEAFAEPQAPIPATAESRGGFMLNPVKAPATL